MVVDKKLFQLFHKLFSEVVNMLSACQFVVVVFHGHETIVALPFLFFALFNFYNSNWAAGHHTSLQSWFVHQYKDVHWVTVLGLGGWEEPKCIRKRHPGGQDFL